MTNTSTTSGAADDSLLLCASDLQHSAIYDNHVEMQACIRAVANRIAALASAAQPGADERRLRRILCARYEFLPYMDDGEAQGQKLDWLRCTVDQIEARILEVNHERFLASAAAPAEPAEAEMVCAEAYQVVGLLLIDLGIFDTKPAMKILDNLSQAKLAHKDVLPWSATPQPQPDTAYASLPRRPGYSHESGRDTVYGYTTDQMRAFADATYALRASRGQAPAQQGVQRLSEQDAGLLEQAASLLEDVEGDERNRGNCSTAEGAACSAHAVRRLASALLAADRAANSAPTAPSVLEDAALSQAARDVLAERQRQISTEGWTPEHDDEHSLGEMALAAACYAASAQAPASLKRRQCPGYWPWAAKWWKPSDTRRDLIKAGALILAELERLDRAAAHAQEQQP